MGIVLVLYLGKDYEGNFFKCIFICFFLFYWWAIKKLSTTMYGIISSLILRIYLLCTVVLKLG